MGRTVRAFQRHLKYNKNTLVKSTRRQIPTIKRKTHHQHRQSNFYADEIAFTSFSRHQHKRADKDTIPSGQLRNGKYNLERHFEDYDKADDCHLSQRAKLQNYIRGKNRQAKFNQYSFDTTAKAGKNGLWNKDLLLMAWKMLKRRGEIRPFSGHRDRTQLCKRETFF